MKYKTKINYYELEYYLKREGIVINNDSLWFLAKKLVNQAYPTYKDKFDRKWDCFYLPVKREGKLISLHFWIMEYERKFYIFLGREDRFDVKKGKNKIEGIYKTILLEALRFWKKYKKNKILIEKTLPYDVRTGKIIGKYLLSKIMSKEERLKLERDYMKNQKKKEIGKQISLNDYLNVAAICYKAAYRKECKNLSPIKMYKKWADGRDNGLLNIRNKDSKKEFAEWLKTEAYGGGHPFEIVFSWINHGIHLYPPSESEPRFSIRVTNYGYVIKFIDMIKALIKKKILFVAPNLLEVLNYLSGNTYFRVNEHSEHSFYYIPSRKYKKKFFKHIEWDDITIPKPK